MYPDVRRAVHRGLSLREGMLAKASAVRPRAVPQTQKRVHTHNTDTEQTTRTHCAVYATTRNRTLSLTHSYIHTFIHSYIHTFMHSYIQRFIHSKIRTLRQGRQERVSPTLLIHSYILTFIHSHIHVSQQHAVRTHMHADATSDGTHGAVSAQTLLLRPGQERLSPRSSSAVLRPSSRRACPPPFLLKDFQEIVKSALAHGATADGSTVTLLGYLFSYVSPLPGEGAGNPICHGGLAA